MTVAYQLPHTLAGVVSMSGYLPFYGEYKRVKQVKKKYSLTILVDYRRVQKDPTIIMSWKK
jgi:hypothetical protein